MLALCKYVSVHLNYFCLIVFSYLFTVHYFNMHYSFFHHNNTLHHQCILCKHESGWKSSFNAAVDHFAHDFSCIWHINSN